MGMRLAGLLLISLLIIPSSGLTQEFPDISSVKPDLNVPEMEEGNPAPGKRVKVVTEGYRGTDVHHALYLPKDWQQGGRYPVIVEYAGNGPYRNKFGDRCSGKVEDCNLGYGISGGLGVIWICLPYLSDDGQKNQLQWWGDVEATVKYCRQVVAQVCRDYGGDPGAVFIAGFSRGSIACNYIGLHNDEIAALWRGFICHSHYDGVKKWGYQGSDRESAAMRLARLGDRPQFISHERSVDGTRKYLQEVFPDGKFTFQTLAFRNHTDLWVLRDTAERKAVRAWFRDILKSE